MAEFPEVEEPRRAHLTSTYFEPAVAARRPVGVLPSSRPWERVGVDRVIDRVEAKGGDARAKLRRLFALSSSPARDLFKIELAIRDWARRDRAVAKRLKRIDNRRMDYLRSQFRELCHDEDEVETRCLLVMSMYIGTRLLAADHGSRRRADMIKRAQNRLLEAQT